MLDHLIENEAFCFQQKKVIRTAIESFKHHSADFSDCLILANSIETKMPLLTFDKKLAKIDGAILLQY